MGLLIIFVIIAAIGWLLLKISYCQSDTLDLVGLICFAGGAIVSIFLIVVMILTAILAPIQFPSIQQEAIEYQIIVNNTPVTEAQLIYSKAVQFNKKVREKRDSAHSFLLLGLESQLWDEVPLIEFYN